MKLNEDETLVGRDYRTGNLIRVEIQNGTIVRVSDADADDRPASFIAPGLADLQVNGYAGSDLNVYPLKAQTIRDLSKALWSKGVTTYLPTIITNSDESILRAVRTIGQAVGNKCSGAESIAGVHLEGPFISPLDGPRGAHDRRYVKPPDWDLFCVWQEAACGLIRLVTLSPEWDEAPLFIRNCIRDGVRVAIGHTNADTAQIARAVDAGATLSTHLGNGAHPVLPRHPNYIWDQLAEDRLWASVIADGFHLPDSVLKVVTTVKPNTTILVSDAVALSGMKPGMYDTPVGGKVVLTEHGKLHLAGNPSLLAGSVTPVFEAVQHLVHHGLCSLQEAWEMASIRPARFLGLPTAAGLSEGAPADLVIFTRDTPGWKINRVIQGGMTTFASTNEKKNIFY